MRTNRLVAAIVMLTGLLGVFNNCQSKTGTSTGNPVVSVEIEPYTLGSSKLSIQSVTSLKMCIKRLRFKTSTLAGEDFDFDLGEVTISPGGTSLGDVEAPTGTFSRIEFVLNDSCFGGKSLTVTNSNGTYSTNEGMQIRFDGILTIDESTTSISLYIQDIVDALNTVTNNSQVRSAAESASGDL